MENEYMSVKSMATAEITEKKSKFISNIMRVETVDAANDFIARIKKKHYDARHNVYAYILADGTKKYSDDGEPSKTGGFPVLELLEKEGYTDVVCVVTRYFGGILLGTGGLIRAYTLSAKEGLEKAGRLYKKYCDIIKINADYTFLSKIEHIIKSEGAMLKDTEYTDKVTVTVVSEVDKTEHLTQTLTTELGNGLNIENMGKNYVEI